MGQLEMNIILHELGILLNEINFDGTCDKMKNIWRFQNKDDLRK